MPPKLLFLTLGLAVACCSCADERPAAPVPPLAETLVGTWETVEMRIDYRTYMGQDTSYTEHIREAEWGRKFGVQPPRTDYTPDGKLTRTHRLRDGQITHVTNGLWKHDGDSLRVIEPNVTFAYRYDTTGGRLVLNGLVDQDQDGQRDDDFYAVYRLVSTTR